MKVPRRSPTPRPPARDRARPGRNRATTRPARRAMRGRVPVEVSVVPEPSMLPVARRSPFTRRAVAFAAVLLLIALSVAYPAQRYVAQRKHIAQLRLQVTAGAAQVAALERATLLRAEPFYVEREARLRLHYVLPGEAALRVIDPPPPAGTLGATLSRAATGAWWDRLLDSVAVAATPIERLPAGMRRGSPGAR